MFHRALWMRNWKQGKYIILLFFFSCLYFFPYKYYQAAQQQLDFYHKLHTEGKFYYEYTFFASNSFWIAFIAIILGCILIGWERRNQSEDMLMAMPFKRRDIFLSKWLFGFVHIVGSFFISWILMYLVYKSTIHFEYQSFYPFHRYFLYAIISYVAIYTATLCIGTFTGSVISQSIFSITFLVMGCGVFSLGLSFLITHWNAVDNENHWKTSESLYEFNEKTSISAPINKFTIGYNYDPKNRRTDDTKNTLKGPAFHQYYSAKAMLVPVFYTICCLLLGTFLFTRTRNENHMKIFLFQKHRLLWISGTTLYFALIGGRFSNPFGLLLNYYVGFFLVGSITYFILSRASKYKIF
ncbi:ABC transporter permease [Bacillus sp. FJAT-53711]|uniref:ABC transporter permease n=1 Tax=Bacillus yunxiaonensis TaxID=3127665 RepID=A0ABU8FSZ0_9BACI